MNDRTLKRRKIKSFYKKFYEKISCEYNLPNNIHLKLIFLDSSQTSTHGSFCVGGYKYSNFEPVIKINFYREIEDIKRTIIHEFCHAINYYHINNNSHPRPTHDKTFWGLCKKFGLRKCDYYKTTQIMKQVWSR